MRREDIGLIATLAFMFCVCAITIGLSLMKIYDPGPQPHLLGDRASGTAK